MASYYSGYVCPPLSFLAVPQLLPLSLYGRSSDPYPSVSSGPSQHNGPVVSFTYEMASGEVSFRGYPVDTETGGKKGKRIRKNLAADFHSEVRTRLSRTVLPLSLLKIRIPLPRPSRKRGDVPSKLVTQDFLLILRDFSLSRSILVLFCLPRSRRYANVVSARGLQKTAKGMWISSTIYHTGREYAVAGVIDGLCLRCQHLACRTTVPGLWQWRSNFLCLI